MHKEQRSQQVQLQAKENKITGILKYNVRSLLIQNSFYEIISPGAFKYDVVKAIFNHDTNIVLGSTRSNTLRLEDTTEGLNFEIDVPTSRADILESISRKDVEAASFGMNVIDDSWDYSESYPIRTISKAELFEISPTPFPCYEENTVSTRAMEQIKNNKKGGKNIMNEQLKKILAMLAAGNTNEEIKAEIETMLGSETKADPTTEEALRSILSNINQNKNKGGKSDMTKEELRTMMGEIQTEETTKGELRSAVFTQTPGAEKVPTEKEYRSAFRSMIRGKADNIELRTLNATVNASGGFLIGSEFHNKIIEMKRDMVDLSTHFNSMPVGSLTGVIPVEVLGDLTPMVIVGENEANKDGQEPHFTQVSYSVREMREVYKISNNLINDAEVDIMGFLQRKIALKDTFSTNYYILNGMDTAKKEGLLTNPLYENQKLLAGVTLKEMQSILTSFDPAVRDSLNIITNTDGFTYLSSLVYADGRLVLQTDATKASGHTFLGKNIIELSNKLLPTNETDGVPMIICHKDAVMLFNRQSYEVLASTEAGFDDNSTKVRVTVRKDIKTGIDEESAKIIYTKIA